MTKSELFQLLNEANEVIGLLWPPKEHIAKVVQLQARLDRALVERKDEESCEVTWRYDVGSTQVAALYGKGLSVWPSVSGSYVWNVGTPTLTGYHTVAGYAATEDAAKTYAVLAAKDL